MKISLRLCAALFCATASATAFSGELVESFSIDESFTDSMQYPQGYAEYVEGEFSESNISNKGKHGTYRVSHPVRNYGEGSAIYYIGQPKADHTYDLSYSFYQMWNRTNQATFRIYKLDGTTTEATVNLRGSMIEGDAGKIVTLEIAKGITGVDKVELLNTAPDQNITSGLAEWQNPGWVILDELIVKVYAPDDTSGGGGTTPALCSVYDYDLDWSGLVESAEGTKTSSNTYTDVIGDVNKDGIEDRIVSDGYSTRVQFMNADLTYEEGPTISGGGHTFARKAGDFSKDGIPDVMLGRLGSITMVALEEDGSVKKQTELSPWKNGLEMSFRQYSRFGYDAVAAADADGDGFIETYLATVSGHYVTTNNKNYNGLLMFQVDENGQIPTSPNKLKWIPISDIGGNFETVDIMGINAYGNLNLILGSNREVNNNIVSNEFRYVTLNSSFQAPLGGGSTRINDKIITHHYPDVTNSKIGYFTDGVNIPGRGYFVPTHSPATLVTPGGSNLNNIIARGINNMPPLVDGTMSMQATNVSAFINFAGTGKTVLNVGGRAGVYTITLDSTQQ